MEKTIQSISREEMDKIKAGANPWLDKPVLPIG